MTNIDHPLTIQWVLFGFKGRIGRKTFVLSALLLVLVQAALLAFATRYATPSDEAGTMSMNGGGAALFGLVFIASWGLSAWALLALAVKRLHDLSLPIVLGVCLILPGISFFAWLFLAAMPSKQEPNEHGPVPFPK